MTGAVRSLQWTIQDMNGSVEHLGQSHDHLRRAQNIMAWTTAIFGALLLSGLVWIANDIFHLKDQLMESDSRFDVMETQMTALGTRIDDLNISIEQLSAELLVSRGVTPPANSAGTDVSILSTPSTPERLQTAASAPLDVTVTDAEHLPRQQQRLLLPQRHQWHQRPIFRMISSCRSTTIRSIRPMSCCFSTRTAIRNNRRLDPDDIEQGVRIDCLRCRAPLTTSES